MSAGQEIQLTEDGDWWVARDVETGVVSQGWTRTAALENLDEAVAMYRGEAGHEPTDEELRDLGLDPDIARSEDGELSDILQ